MSYFHSSSAAALPMRKSPRIEVHSECENDSVECLDHPRFRVLSNSAFRLLIVKASLVIQSMRIPCEDAGVSLETIFGIDGTSFRNLCVLVTLQGHTRRMYSPAFPDHKHAAVT